MLAMKKNRVVGPKGSLTMRVLGPARKTTQIEISLTDGFVLGVKPPVRDSGDLAGSPGGTIKGPKGEAAIEEGIMLLLVIFICTHLTLKDLVLRIRTALALKWKAIEALYLTTY